MSSGLSDDFLHYIELGTQSFQRVKDSSEFNNFMETVRQLQLVVEEAAAGVDSDADYAMRVSRECFRFVILCLEDRRQEKGMLTPMNDCATLKNWFRLVKDEPGKYLKTIQENFGPDFSPRDTKRYNDEFKSALNRLKRRVGAERKGMDSAGFQRFCDSRLALLAAIGKKYAHYRDAILDNA